MIIAILHCFDGTTIKRKIRKDDRLENIRTQDAAHPDAAGREFAYRRGQTVNAITALFDEIDPPERRPRQPGQLTISGKHL